MVSVVMLYHVTCVVVPYSGIYWRGIDLDNLAIFFKIAKLIVDVPIQHVWKNIMSPKGKFWSFNKFELVNKCYNPVWYFRKDWLQSDYSYQYKLYM